MKVMCKWDSWHAECVRYSSLVPFPTLFEAEKFGLENCRLLLWFSVASFVTLTISFFVYLFII